MALTPASHIPTEVPSMNQDIVTPATYVASDPCFSPSVGNSHKNWNGNAWTAGRGTVKREAPLPESTKLGTERKTRNILKRAMHKMRKKGKRIPESVVVLPEPPKIDDLDIQPQLLQKYLLMKEHQRRRIETGEEPMASKSTAMLVLIGLLYGTHAWLKDRARRVIAKEGALVVTFLATWGVGSACMLLLNRFL